MGNSQTSSGFGDQSNQAQQVTAQSSGGPTTATASTAAASAASSQNQVGFDHKIHFLDKFLV